MERDIKILSTANILAEHLADDLVNCIKCSSDSVTIAFSGGKTPELLFTILGNKYSNSVDWQKIHFFWVDERCVPPMDPESNFGMTHRTFLSKININENNVHRIMGENDPVQEAERYSEEIRQYVTFIGKFPSFNIVLLGLGEDGHTASIFPGNNELFLSHKFCEVAVHPQTGQKRITITGNVINNARQIFFLVAGTNKAKVLEKIISSENKEKQFPAEYVKPVNGKITWYLDEAAGSLLKKGD